MTTTPVAPPTSTDPVPPTALTAGARFRALLARAGLGPVGAIALAGIAVATPVAAVGVSDAWRLPTVTLQAAAQDVQAADARGLQAGQPIMFSRDGHQYRCTLGIPWTTDGGAPAWVTAGHCAPHAAAVLEVGEAGLRPTGISLSQEEQLVDAIQVISALPGQDQLTLAGQPIIGSGTLAPGDRVCLQGTTTGLSCGWIVRSGVEVHEVSGSLTRGALIAGRGQVCVSPGDSGGPVFTEGRDGIRVVGIINASRPRWALPLIVPDRCEAVVTTVAQLQETFGGQPRQ